MSCTEPAVGGPAPPSSPPIFIVGCGRSGTTLLRMMLNSHPELSIPEESHVLYQIARKRSFGLWPGRRSPSWVDRFLRFVERSPYVKNWDLPPGDLRSRVDTLPEKSLGALLTAMYDAYRAKDGKPRWGDKTPMLVQHLWIVDRFFPDARIIHVIRDARDVAQSLLTKSFGPRHISHAGLYWKWLVLSGMVSGRILGPERYLEVRFEDLLREPQSTLHAITEFADLEYSNELLAYHESAAAKKYAEKGDRTAARLTKPLDSSRLFLWRKAMPAQHVRSILRQAGAVLRLQGYECDGLPAAQERDAALLRDLLSAESLARLDDAASARSGGRAARVAGLQIDRMKQARAFFAHGWEEWARCGIRWQRTVARMLD